MRHMEKLRFHCLAKFLNADDRKYLRDITGFDFVHHDGVYDIISDETIQDIYKKIPVGELERLFKKYGILEIRPDDGKHAIVDGFMPEPNVQLRIQCKEPIGGAAALGDDAKWYFTYDMRLDMECEFTVTHWEYL